VLIDTRACPGGGDEILSVSARAAASSILLFRAGVVPVTDIRVNEAARG